MARKLILGLILLAATGAFTGLVIAGNQPGGPEYTVSVLGQDIATLNTLAVFCAGLALALPSAWACRPRRHTTATGRSAAARPIPMSVPTSP